MISSQIDWAQGDNNIGCHLVPAPTVILEQCESDTVAMTPLGRVAYPRTRRNGELQSLTQAHVELQSLTQAHGGVPPKLDQEPWWNPTPSPTKEIKITEKQVKAGKERKLKSLFGLLFTSNS
ncbi:unnamed protein product [Dovyalis caffra]|uniref:Uncharacterized protein n=1 Tax=Dovyalis caffra TaxID=77055 RepID=A0AAV1SEV2_9ROSI|nr:unnamed protein product [Dovyalis caffra]